METALLFAVGILLFVIVQMGKHIAHTNTHPSIVYIETIKEVQRIPLHLLAALVSPIDVNGRDAVSVGGVYFAFLDDGKQVVRFSSFRNKWIKVSWLAFEEYCTRYQLQLPTSGQASVIAIERGGAPTKPANVPDGWWWNNDYGAWVAP